MSLHQLDHFINTPRTCNLFGTCKHCFIENIPPEKEILSFEQIEKIYQNFSDNGIKKAVVTGGEPLARPGYLRILKAACHYFKTVNVQTNGTMYQNFRNFDNLAVTLSLESADPTYDSYIRGPEHWEITHVNLIQYIETLGPNRVTIRSTIFQDNDIQGLLDLAQELGTGWIGVRFKQMGCGKKRDELAPTAERMLDVYDTVYEHTKKHKSEERVFIEEGQYYLVSEVLHNKYGKYFKKAGTPCPWGHRLAMQVNGELFPCFYAMGDDRFLLGNALETPWEEIQINMDKLIRERDTRKFIDQCITCKYKPECGGNCSLLNWEVKKRGDDVCPLHLFNELKNGTKKIPIPGPS